MSTPVRTPKVPPLVEGDRLTRAEFERRYHAMPELKKAELIDGVVYMGSPVRLRQHGTPHGHLVGWLYIYSNATPGVTFGDNATTRLDDNNEPQPDAVLIIESGGQAGVDADGYLEGGPELAAEIAAEGIDARLTAKKEAYRRHKVRELLIWRVEESKFDWYELRRGRYVLVKADEQGVIRSNTFPGLWLDVPGLLRLDGNAVVATLQQGLVSEEHKAFVAKLKGHG
jgi:Uma2 family endonuclease